MITKYANRDYANKRILTRLHTRRALRTAIGRARSRGTIMRRWGDNGAILPERAYFIQADTGKVKALPQRASNAGQNVTAGFNIRRQQQLQAGAARIARQRAAQHGGQVMLAEFARSAPHRTSAPMVNNINAASPAAHYGYDAHTRMPMPPARSREDYPEAPQHPGYYKPTPYERPRLYEQEASRRKRRKIERIKAGLIGAATIMGAAKLKHLEKENRVTPGVAEIGTVLAGIYGADNLRKAFKDDDY